MSYSFKPVHVPVSYTLKPVRVAVSYALKPVRVPMSYALKPVRVLLSLYELCLAQLCAPFILQRSHPTFPVTLHLQGVELVFFSSSA